MKNIPQYLTYVEELLAPEERADLGGLLARYGMAGTEVFMNEAHPRTEMLFQGEAEKASWVKRFSDLRVKRVHCSYYAYPTHFITRSHWAEFMRRLEGPGRVEDYYGDLEAVHMFRRWAQEYELAAALGCQAYVFHVIDYAAIDGAWDFVLSREEILQAMIGMVQSFLIYLGRAGLLSEASPLIELENAGWGLEYGVQICEDYAALFNQVDDPLHKLRVGWDVNHLLHAIGKKGDGAGFMLQDFEMTARMARLEADWGHEPGTFAMKWLEMNILDPALAGRTGCLHLSDCALKTVEYFRNGRLQGEYGEKIDAIEGFDAKSDYGVGIVLEHYDSHLTMGDGVLNAAGMRRIIEALAKENPGFVLLHELKNSKPLLPELERQLAFLEG